MLGDGVAGLGVTGAGVAGACVAGAGVTGLTVGAGVAGAAVTGARVAGAGVVVGFAVDDPYVMYVFTMLLVKEVTTWNKTSSWLNWDVTFSVMGRVRPPEAENCQYPQSVSVNADQVVYVL